LDPGLSRKGIWAIVTAITNDRQHEQAKEFFDKKTSRRGKNEAYVIGSAIQEYRAVLGLANLAEKSSDMKKGDEMRCPLILRYFLFFDRELEDKAGKELGVGKKEESERQKAALMGKRFKVVPLCNIKSYFVTINSRVYFGIMRDIYEEFGVNREEFSGENRDTYRKSIFYLKSVKTSKQKKFTWMVESDEVSMCVHFRRLKANRPVPSSASPLRKHAEKKEADPATQKVQDNDFVVGADPGDTNIIAIAVSKRMVDVTDGNLRHKDMRLLKFSRTRYHRESGIMSAREKI